MSVIIGAKTIWRASHRKVYHDDHDNFKTVFMPEAI